MTIAACYISKQGIVFGADSTTTYHATNCEPHYFKFEQKIFEIGEQDSRQAAITWGLGCLPNTSYREMFATLSDNIVIDKPKTMGEIAEMWSGYFWGKYSGELQNELARVKVLESNSTRTDDEEEELEVLQNSLIVGFCIGGICLPNRSPAAFELVFTPSLSSAPVPIALTQSGRGHFWGIPNLILRLIVGCDPMVYQSILNSGKWTGTDQELAEICVSHKLELPFELPIREAIDYLHASVYTTIKAMKFSHLSPHCGGPVEIATITADRPFRWVKHKGFDSAILE